MRTSQISLIIKNSLVSRMHPKSTIFRVGSHDRLRMLLIVPISVTSFNEILRRR